jgi:hypothetical protein
MRKFSPWLNWQWLLTDVSPQNIFDLLLLEFSFNDKAPTSIYATSCTHFYQQETDNMSRLTVHTTTDITNVCKYGLLVAFAMDLWGSKSITF